MKFGRGSTGDSLWRSHSSADAPMRTVRTTTLNGLIERYSKGGVIDLCKMDVEGAEWDVFSGEHFSRITQCRNVIMEIHSRESMTAQQMYDRFSKLGFAVAGRDPAATVVWFRMSGI
jgi:hypothetical protein